MSPDYHVYSRYRGREFFVKVEADVIQRDDGVHALRAEVPHAFTGLFDDIPFYIKAIRIGDQRFQAGRYEAKYAHAHITLFDYFRLGIKAVNSGVLEGDIGGEHGELERWPQPCKYRNAAVEVVIAEHPRVKAERR
ncbi:hypothetical protein SDC9_144928 [bioreactor metagenome]|uniref:Uncharacterized protein n=1 Tax=bioreactor metagenome TaxID=1076179 RepID=A0A645E8K0_9ZZZZ